MAPPCPYDAMRACDVLCRTLLGPGLGVTVTGTLHCKKHKANSRKLEIELEYRRINCAGNEGEPPLVAQSFKVC